MTTMMALIDKQPRSAMARATKESVVKEIDGLINDQSSQSLFTSVVFPAPEGALIINIFRRFKDLTLFIIIIIDYNTHE